VGEKLPTLSQRVRRLDLTFAPFAFPFLHTSLHTAFELTRIGAVSVSRGKGTQTTALLIPKRNHEVTELRHHVAITRCSGHRCRDAELRKRPKSHETRNATHNAATSWTAFRRSRISIAWVAESDHLSCWVKIRTYICPPRLRTRRAIIARRVWVCRVSTLKAGLDGDACVRVAPFSFRLVGVSAGGRRVWGRIGPYVAPHSHQASVRRAAKYHGGRPPHYAGGPSGRARCPREHRDEREHEHHSGARDQPRRWNPVGDGQVAAVNGVATFSNLRIDNPGAGYTLTASANGLNGATSGAFTVSGFAAVTAGGNHSCGLTAAGAPYCWGVNSEGELGNGSTTNSSTPAAVSGGLTFAAVHAGPGSAHSCGVTTASAAYCWGYNGYGQLGNGSTSNSTVPVAVAGGLAFAVVSGGFGHSCGVTGAGAAYCWGWNFAGQLGNGSTTNSSTPVAVTGGLTFLSVSAGEYHSCGLTAAGAGYCWGDNTSGQLGNGSTTSRSAPAAVAGGLTFVAVNAGGAHSCGLTAAGVAYCWGANSFGELGNGANTIDSTPVAVAGGLTFAAVRGGNDHTCGLSTAGAAYCWGDNADGELGNGTTTNSNTPVAVTGGLTFAAVSAGSGFSCGVTTAGTAYCWGRNVGGQLGNGSTTSSSTPVRVSNP